MPMPGAHPTNEDLNGFKRGEHVEGPLESRPRLRITPLKRLPGGGELDQLEGVGWHAQEAAAEPRGVP